MPRWPYCVLGGRGGCQRRARPAKGPSVHHTADTRGRRRNISRLPPSQETRQLLQKYGGKFDYDVDLEHVEGTGLDSISALASLL